MQNCELLLESEESKSHMDTRTSSMDSDTICRADDVQKLKANSLTALSVKAARVKLFPPSNLYHYMDLNRQRLVLLSKSI